MLLYVSWIYTWLHNGGKHWQAQAGCTFAVVIHMGLKKMSSIFNSYPIWHLTFLHKMTVCGILCMWVVSFFFFFGSFQTSMYILSVVFSFCYTLNHQFKGEKKTCWNNIYSHLDKYCIFWIHFEFGSSDGKLGKFCIAPQIWKIVTKFTIPLLFHQHTWEPKSYNFECISLELNSQDDGAKMRATIFT